MHFSGNAPHRMQQGLGVLLGTGLEGEEPLSLLAGNLGTFIGAGNPKGEIAKQSGEGLCS